jgi:hypothetical protein
MDKKNTYKSQDIALVDEVRYCRVVSSGSRHYYVLKTTFTKKIIFPEQNNPYIFSQLSFF